MVMPTETNGKGLYFNASSGQSCSVKIKLNVTNIKGIYIVGSGVNDSGKGLLSYITNDLNFNADFVTQTANLNFTGSTNGYIDTSTLTGEYYLVFRTTNGRTGYITNVFAIS